MPESRKRGAKRWSAKPGPAQRGAAPKKNEAAYLLFRILVVE
ncbi:hypothetical protein [Sediminispirochaeta bajacaliforniensis]|nr:hypothetical protein [Sediminispirochaeta bajacaliforniensis]